MIRLKSLGMGLGLGLILFARISAEPADHVFLGEHIVTMTGEGETASALALTGETITWIGDRENADSQIAPDTEVHELGERALLPGFIDAHGHFMFQGIQALAANVASPPVGPVEDIEGLKAVVRAYIDQNQIAAGQPVVAFGYDDSLLKEQRHPTRDDLDAISTEHPVAVFHVSGHLMVGNSTALEKVGYGPDTADPEGGHLQRRTGSTEPNGVLEETAMGPLQDFAIRAIFRPAETTRAASDIFARHGITTVQDGRMPVVLIPIYRQLAAGGMLNLDIVAYVDVRDPDYVLPAGMAYGTYEGRFKIGGVKLMLDGSPQGKTAYLSAPYHVPPHGKDADYRGYPTQPHDAVDAMVASYLSQEIPIIAHANGDEAAEMLIGALERANATHDHRAVMIHAQTVRDDQLDRMAKLGMIPSFFSSHVFYWGDWHRDSVLGPERGARISPTRSSIERGITFTLHNDAPVVPPDMIRLLWASVNRLTRSGKVLGEAQRLTVYEALEGMTQNAAYQHFEEDVKGTLEVGKQADLVVLSENPLTTEPGDLLGLKVEQTWSRGVRVFEREAE